MQKNIIIADVGGTNGRFATAHFENGNNTPLITDIVVLHCPVFETFDEMFGAYIKTLSGNIPKIAQLAVAGEMTSRNGNLWHFNWDISASRLEKKFNLNRVTLMNDYEAMVRSIPHLNAEDLFTVTDFSEGLRNGPYSVFGVGSGLGGSIGKPGENGLSVVSSEIGHVSFAPKSKLESDLLSFAQKTLDHVSNESFLSGPGLKRIHEFMCSNGDDADKNLSPSDITAAALKKTNDACVKTVDIFLDILASVAGDIALSQGARGSIYISGGIVPQLVDLIDRDRFKERFNDKGPMTDYVKKIPVKIITSEMPALLGASMDIY